METKIGIENRLRLRAHEIAQIGMESPTDAQIIAKNYKLVQLLRELNKLDEALLSRLFPSN